MEQFPLFQTGSGRPVTISERSIERSRAAVNKGDAEKSGKIGVPGSFEKKLGLSVL